MEKCCETLWWECMALAPGETAGVLSDPGTRGVAECFHGFLQAADRECQWLEMPVQDQHGSEPPPAVARWMTGLDVLVMATTKSLSHTRARREACQAGARVASMPGVTREMVERTMGASYGEIHRAGQAVCRVLDGGSRVRLWSAAGTDLRLSIEGRTSHNDDGQIHRPGDFGNLPAGEAFVAPREGSAEGVLVVDAGMAGIGRIGEPVVITVEKGRAVRIEGGTEAACLREILARHGPEAANIAELGIGTHPGARLTGAILEDEKVRGTVHVALGTNAYFGGCVEAGVHLDGVLRHPGLAVDGVRVMEDGVWLGGETVPPRGG